MLLDHDTCYRAVTAKDARFDGQFVTVFVEGVEPILAITIPRAAVLQDQQGSYAFIVDGEGKAQRRNLRLGRNHRSIGLTGGGNGLIVLLLADVLGAH